MKKAFLVLFLFIGYAVSAQTIYEIKYSFNKVDANGKETNEVDKEYSALLFYFQGQTSNTMRVKYYDNSLNANIIVEQTMVTSLYNQGGLQYWALTGQDAKYVSVTKPSYAYNPDKIILTKNPADQYYSPAYVASPMTNGSEQRGKIIAFNTLEKVNVTNNFLADYGWHWPENNTNDTKTKTNNGNFDLSRSTLYLIQVTNTLDMKLGLGFYENHKNIKKLFSEAASTAGIGFKSIEVMGYDYSKENVQKTIADFQPGPNDIVIFYYSGHGYRYDDQKSDWPRMALSNTFSNIEELHNASLSLDDDVYKPLTQKGAHLTLVIGECCNTSIGVTPTMQDPMKMHQGDYIFNPDAMKSLFKQSGNLLLATSKPNESTWYYQTLGGCFGNNFITSMSKETNFTNPINSVNWKNIIDNSVAQTVKQTSSGETPAEQDPILHYEIK